jgi:hypothetical protein
VKFVFGLPQEAAPEVNEQIARFPGL